MPSIESSLFRMLLLSQRMLGVTRMPLSVQRAQFEISSLVRLPPASLHVTATQIAGRRAEWLRHPDDLPGHVLLYIHGGAYVMGSPLTHRGLVARIARASGIAALQIDYRLAPEHPFPAALDDVLAAYDWLGAQGYAPTQIVLAGDSAGAGLAMALLLSLRERGLALPRAALLLSPWVDLVGEGESVYTRRDQDPYLTPDLIRLVPLYCGTHNPREPLISPVFADLHGLPPLLIQVGNDEILLSDATRLAERARAAGVQVELTIWPGMWHVWQLFAPWLPEAREAIEQMASFVRSQCLSAPVTDV